MALGEHNMVHQTHPDQRDDAAQVGAHSVEAVLLDGTLTVDKEVCWVTLRAR